MDHITLLQEYIESPDPSITRVEIVDGQFLYAIRSDTSRGFQLCPAEFLLRWLVKLIVELFSRLPVFPKGDGQINGNEALSKTGTENANSALPAVRMKIQSIFAGDCAKGEMTMGLIILIILIILLLGGGGFGYYRGGPRVGGGIGGILFLILIVYLILLLTGNVVL